MIDNKHTQYAIMTEKTEYGYVPNYDELVANAPNDEMKAKWIESKELHARMLKSDFPKASAFAYNGIYMMKMACGHYEIFQHHARDESDLIDWIELMQVEEKNRKCYIIYKRNKRYI